jgi:hypothetical protein
MNNDVVMEWSGVEQRWYREWTDGAEWQSNGV